ncbi:hypothetical protein J2X53_003179 [Pseudorhodobacter sp. 4114]|nr:hypothetical protein [Pseudorhodobacter sp. 4114]
MDKEAAISREPTDIAMKATMLSAIQTKPCLNCHRAAFVARHDCLT